MTSDPTDKSLLRCTIKKSADVFAKLVLWTSYAVCGVTALALAGYGAFALYSISSKPTGEFAVAIWSIASAAFSAVFLLLAAIPWYIYVGIAAVAAIPVYSLLWCIARELTEEDWKSDVASWWEFVVVFPAIATLVVEAIFDIKCQNIIGFAYCDYVMRFPRAHLHYRKRMKEERK